MFTLCSGLYFRGKLTYARHFADPPRGLAGVQIITPSRGLVTADTLVGAADLAEIAAIPVDLRDRASPFRCNLLHSAH